MQARYFRINRAAYTVGELSVVTVGPRRWLLPAFIVRLLVLKLLRKTVPIGNPIADIRLMATLDDREAGEIRERYPCFQEIEPALARVGFTDVSYCRGDDPRYRYQSYGLYGVDGSGSTGVTCVVMGNAQFQVNWTEFYSLLHDGRTLRSNDHPNAGALRPAPSAIKRRMSGAKTQDLHRSHSAELRRMRSLGSHFVQGMDRDQAIQADRDCYRDQIAHWIEMGLLVADQSSEGH
jgi:hypothetical protein